MLEVRNLVKYYGKKKAVDGISFTAGDGEVLGFLGPNGAGKSTVMNMITGYISMTSGEVKIDGTDILKNPIEAKRRLGYLPEQPPVYPELTVREYLSFAAELKGVKEDIAAEVTSAAERTGIGDMLGRRCGNLSKGCKQRAGLAAALLGDPNVLILDEPTAGLDPRQIIDIRELIRSLGREHTVLMSSHILSEISAVCDRVLIINDGKLAAEDTPAALSRREGDGRAARLILRADGADEEIRAVLDSLGIEGERSENGEYSLSLPTDGDIKKRLFFAFAGAGIAITEQREETPTLEDAFIELTEKETE